MALSAEADGNYFGSETHRSSGKPLWAKCDPQTIVCGLLCKNDKITLEVLLCISKLYC